MNRTDAGLYLKQKHNDQDLLLAPYRRIDTLSRYYSSIC